MEIRPGILPLRATSVKGPLTEATEITEDGDDPSVIYVPSVRLTPRGD